MFYIRNFKVSSLDKIASRSMRHHGFCSHIQPGIVLKAPCALSRKVLSSLFGGGPSLVHTARALILAYIELATTSR